MRRRDFILAGGATVAWPLAARGQQSDQLRRIAVLGSSPSDWGDWISAFVERLRELGWKEGRTIAIEYRWSEGRPERVAEAAATFMQQKPDVIVTYGGAATILKKATTSIPIVFAVAADPLGSGLVTSLSRPGGNMTGLSIQQNDASGRRLELLREVVPGLRRLAIMFDGGYRGSVVENGQVQAIAQKIGLEASPHEIRRPGDIAPVFAALKAHADAVYIVEKCLNYQQSYTDRHACTQHPVASDLHYPRFRQSWGAYLIRTKLSGSVPARRGNGGQDFARGQAGRIAG
jgi:putative ABC transport system substrate-binding protein